MSYPHTLVRATRVGWLAARPRIWRTQSGHFGHYPVSAGFFPAAVFCVYRRVTRSAAPDLSCPPPGAAGMARAPRTRVRVDADPLTLLGPAQRCEVGLAVPISAPRSTVEYSETPWRI